MRLDVHMQPLVKMAVYPSNCVVSLNLNHVSRVKTNRKIVQFLYFQFFVISPQEYDANLNSYGS